MSNLPFVHDYDTAVDTFDVPVECGECYIWYDASSEDECPICGSDELVGDR